MAKTSDPTVVGVKRLGDGTYGVNIKDSLAFLQGKRESDPFLQKNSSSEQSPTQTPTEKFGGVNVEELHELVCPICENLFNAAVVTPCCGHSFCEICTFFIAFAKQKDLTLDFGAAIYFILHLAIRNNYLILSLFLESLYIPTSR